MTYLNGPNYAPLKWPNLMPFVYGPIKWSKKVCIIVLRLRQLRRTFTNCVYVLLVESKSHCIMVETVRQI